MAGRAAIPAVGQQSEAPLRPIIPRDHEVTAEATVEVVSLPAAHASYLAEVLGHGMFLTTATDPAAGILIDNHIAGHVILSNSQHRRMSDIGVVMCIVAAPHDDKRLGRLMRRLVLNATIHRLMLPTAEINVVRDTVTAANPHGKQWKGIGEQIGATCLKNGDWKIQYEGEVLDESPRRPSTGGSPTRPPTRSARPAWASPAAGRDVGRPASAANKSGRQPMTDELPGTLVADLGEGMHIRMVSTHGDLREQPVNAQVMDRGTYETLVANITKRGHLESLPYCAVYEGRVEIVSGHHRISAAQSGGLHTIPVLVDASGCPGRRSSPSRSPTTRSPGRRTSRSSPSCCGRSTTSTTFSPPASTPTSCPTSTMGPSATTNPWRRPSSGAASC